MGVGGLRCAHLSLLRSTLFFLPVSSAVISLDEEFKLLNALLFVADKE
jgi:hypothetical protein